MSVSHADTHAEDCAMAHVKATLEAFTPNQIAKRLGIGAPKVMGWIRSGALKSTNISDGQIPRWVIQEADLKAFLDARSNQPPPAKRGPGRPRTIPVYDGPRYV